MGHLLPIITRSIIGKNGSIVTYYWPGQLGDVVPSNLALNLNTGQNPGNWALCTAAILGPRKKCRMCSGSSRLAGLPALHCKFAITMLSVIAAHLQHPADEKSLSEIFETHILPCWRGTNLFELILLESGNFWNVANGNLLSTRLCFAILIFAFCSLWCCTGARKQTKIERTLSWWYRVLQTYQNHHPIRSLGPSM